MDHLEQNGLAAANGGSRTISLNTPIKDNADLENIRQGLSRDYTAKTEQIAQERKELERMQQQVSILYQQTMQLAQGQKPAQQQPPVETGTPDLAEAYEKRYGVELDPAARQLFGFLGDQLSNAQSKSELAEIKNQMSQLIQAVQGQQQYMQAVAVRPELETMAQHFGEAELQKRMPQVAELMKKGLGFKQALAAADPDFFAETMGKNVLKERERQQKTDNDRIAALLGMGSLEGVVPSPSGESDSEVQFTPGESMVESMRKLLGPAAYNQLLANDAISRG